VACSASTSSGFVVLQPSFTFGQRACSIVQPKSIEAFTITGPLVSLYVDVEVVDPLQLEAVHLRDDVPAYGEARAKKEANYFIIKLEIFSIYNYLRPHARKNSV
jgi:hypothetical protein